MLHGTRNALDRPEMSPFREIRLKTRVQFPNGIRALVGHLGFSISGSALRP
jgi:hypothetical protein